MITSDRPGLGRVRFRGRNRLGFRASAEATGLAPGQHVLQDPDGRAVEVHVGA